MENDDISPILILEKNSEENSSDDTLVIVFLFFLGNIIRHFVQIFSIWDNWHEMLKPVFFFVVVFFFFFFSKKKKKFQYVVCCNFTQSFKRHRIGWSGPSFPTIIIWVNISAASFRNIYLILTRLISEGAGQGSIWSNYRTYSMYLNRQVWAINVDPDQTSQNAASDQGLHCLPLIQQFYTHSQVVKWTQKRSIR